jgi:hypothetical protein
VILAGLRGVARLLCEKKEVEQRGLQHDLTFGDSSRLQPQAARCSARPLHEPAERPRLT